MNGSSAVSGDGKKRNNGSSVVADSNNKCGLDNDDAQHPQKKARVAMTPDEEARIKEILMKKKVLKKKERRSTSFNDGNDGGAAANAANKGKSDNDPKKGGEDEVEAAIDGSNNVKDVGVGDDNDYAPRRRRERSPAEIERRRARDLRRKNERRNRSRGGDGFKGNGRGGGRGPPHCGRSGRDYYPPRDPYGRGPRPLPPPRDYYHGGPPGSWGNGSGGRWHDGRGGGGGGRYDDRYGGGRGGRDDRNNWNGGRGGNHVDRRDERGRQDMYGRERDSGRSEEAKIANSSSRSPSHSRSGSYSTASDHSSHSSGSRSDRSISSSRSPSRDSRRSYSRSVSRSYSRSPSPDSIKRKRSGGGSRSSRSGGGDEFEEEAKAQKAMEDEATKDQRTIFVSQLVMRADERDIGRYFRRKIGIKVRDVILLRDRRTGRHKGCAYVEVGRLEDVDRALGATGKTPDFQRFPILVKRTETDKNSLLIGTGAMGGSLSFTPPLSVTTCGGSFDRSGAGLQPAQLTADGMRIESQKVYVGSIDPCVTQDQLRALFSQFGTLDKVLLQMDTLTGMSRGFAFLSYRDPKDANLAIQTMSGQTIAGRSLKTGWANQQSSAHGVVEVKTDEFPVDANEKIVRVNVMMNQLTGTSLTTMIGQVDIKAQQALLAAGPAGALGILPPAELASVADAALDMALGVTPIVRDSAMLAIAAPAVTVDAKTVGRIDNPTQNILVHNMFDKDEETEKGWEEDIRLDFEEECAQYGKIERVVVMFDDPGGMIYASFDSVEGAMKCAKSVAGRWFDKRQLRVEFVDSIPNSA